MKIKQFTAAALAGISLLTVNVYAYSSLEVNEWIDDRSAVSKYTVVSDSKGLKGIADKSGTIIIDTVYNDIKEIPGWEKFAVQKKDGKWTIINITGGTYFQTTYDYIDTQYCDKGYVEVGYYGENEFKNNVGIIDKNMNLIVPSEYQTYIFTDKDGMILGKLNSDNNYDYYKLTENNSLEYTATLPGILTANSENGLYYIKSYKSCRKYDSETEKYSAGYITTLGLADDDYNVIIEPIYENTSFSFNNGLAIVKKGSTSYEEKVSGSIGNGKYGIIDKTGTEITECIYDSITRSGTNYTFTLDNEKTTLSVNELLGNSNTISVIIDGTKLATDNEPVIVDNYTLLPLRDISEALGAEVSWDAHTKTAVITKDNNIISITVNSDTMLVNNNSVSVSVPAQIINNTTYIPVRNLATALNCLVNWDQENKIVNINTI